MVEIQASIDSVSTTHADRNSSFEKGNSSTTDELKVQAGQDNKSDEDHKNLDACVDPSINSEIDSSIEPSAEKEENKVKLNEFKETPGEVTVSTNIELDPLEGFLENPLTPRSLPHVSTEDQDHPPNS